MDGFTSIRRSIEHMKITVQKVIKGVRYLKHYGVKEFFIRLQEKMESENVPYEPWYEHHKATEETLRRQRKQSAAWKGAPRVSIVVPLYCTNETFLREMIGSVQAQSYENWELCLADGSPKEEAVRLEAVVRECAGFRRKCKIPDHSGITHHIIICQFPCQPDIRHIRKHDLPALYSDRLRRNILQDSLCPAVIFQRHFDPV